MDQKKKKTDRQQKRRSKQEINHLKDRCITVSTQPQMTTQPTETTNGAEPAKPNATEDHTWQCCKQGKTDIPDTQQRNKVTTQLNKTTTTTTTTTTTRRGQGVVGKSDLQFLVLCTYFWWLFLPFSRLSSLLYSYCSLTLLSVSLALKNQTETNSDLCTRKKAKHAIPNLS